MNVPTLSMMIDDEKMLSVSIFFVFFTNPLKKLYSLSIALSFPYSQSSEMSAPNTPTLRPVRSWMGTE